jgi:hypothetical protein
MKMTRLPLIALVVAAAILLTGCEGGNACRKSLEEDGGTCGPGGGGDTGGDGGGGNPGNAEALDLTWAVQAEASQSDLQWMSDRIKQLNNYLWQATEGQAYLRNQTIKNKSSSGDVIIMKVKGSMSNPPAYCTHGSGNWQITLSTGELPAQGFLHELGHGWVGPFADETYNCMDQGKGI